MKFNDNFLKYLHMITKEKRKARTIEEFHQCFIDSPLEKKQTVGNKKSFPLIKSILVTLFIPGVVLAGYQFQNKVESPVRPEPSSEKITTQIKQDQLKQQTRDKYQNRIKSIQALLKEAKELIAQLDYPEDLTDLPTPAEFSKELNLLETSLRTRQEQEQISRIYRADVSKIKHQEEADKRQGRHQAELDNNYRIIEQEQKKRYQEQIELMEASRAQARARQEKQERLNLERVRQQREALEKEYKVEQARQQQVKLQQQLREQQAHGIRYQNISFIEPITGMGFIRVKAGTFMMGSPEKDVDRFFNETLHEVNLSKDYYLGKYEVTQREWEVIMGKNPSYFKNCGENCPVDNVSWNKVQEFIRRLNEKAKARGERGGFRLPTEAEWEYAARAGTKTPFSFGENINTSQVNYNGNEPYNGGRKGKYRVKTIEAYSLQGNAWGFHAMHGNVWEWVSDVYVSYPESSVTDPDVQSGGSRRVSRGGSWDDYAGYCRSSFRGRLKPNSSDNDLGFRLARSSY